MHFIKNFGEFGNQLRILLYSSQNSHHKPFKQVFGLDKTEVMHCDGLHESTLML